MGPPVLLLPWGRLPKGGRPGITGFRGTGLIGAGWGVGDGGCIFGICVVRCAGICATMGVWIIIGSWDLLVDDITSYAETISGICPYIFLLSGCCTGCFRITSEPIEYARTVSVGGFDRSGIDDGIIFCIDTLSCVGGALRTTPTG